MYETRVLDNASDRLNNTKIDITLRTLHVQRMQVNVVRDNSIALFAFKQFFSVENVLFNKQRSKQWF